jgi:hypothetical protein
VLRVELADGADEPHGRFAPVDHSDAAEHRCTSPLSVNVAPLS